MEQKDAIITIGSDFQVDAREYTLTRNGEPVEIPRIPMDMLLILLCRPGELVTRAEIAEAIWPGSSVDEVMYRINTAVNRIRRALLDDPTEPRYVETIIGRGYRFIAPVTVEARESDGEVAERGSPPESLSEQREEESGASSALKNSFYLAVSRHRILMSLLVVGSLALAAWSLRLLRHAATAEVAAPIRLTGNNSDNPVGTAALSPDGQRFVFADADGVLIQARHDLTATPLAMPPLKEIGRLSWFPDGKRIAVSGLASETRVPELWVIAAGGGSKPVLLREGARDGVVSPLTGKIAFLSSDLTEVWLAIDGKDPRLLRTAAPDSTFSDLTWLREEPNLLLNEIRLASRHGVMPGVAVPVSPAQSTLLAVRGDDGSVLASQDGVRLLEGCASSDGVLDLEGTDEQHRTIELKETIRPHAGGVVFTRPVPFQSPGHLRSCSVAATSEDMTVLLEVGRPVIYVGELSPDYRALLKTHAVTTAEHESYPHAWTPDSQAVLFEQFRDGWYLLKQALDRHNPQPLLEPQIEPQIKGVGPRYSPDRKWILFNRSDANGTSSLFHMMAQGQSGPPEQLATPAGDVRCPRSGTVCVLRVKDTIAKKLAIYSVDPANGATTMLRVLPWEEAASSDWDISPDGEAVVVCEPGSAQGVLRVFNLRDAGERTLSFQLEGGALRAVNWTAIGTGWFGVTYTSDGSNIYLLQSSGTATLMHRSNTPTWAVPSPNGRFVAFIDRDQDRNVWLKARQEKR